MTASVAKWYSANDPIMVALISLVPNTPQHATGRGKDQRGTPSTMPGSYGQGFAPRSGCIIGYASIL